MEITDIIIKIDKRISIKSIEVYVLITAKVEEEIDNFYDAIKSAFNEEPTTLS